MRVNNGQNEESSVRIRVSIIINGTILRYVMKCYTVSCMYSKTSKATSTYLFAGLTKGITSMSKKIKSIKL